MANGDEPKPWLAVPTAECPVPVAAKVWTARRAGLRLNGRGSGRGYRRLGDLSTREFGYALACYARMRGEASPVWARHLSPGQAGYLTQGLAYLHRGQARAL